MFLFLAIALGGGFVLFGIGAGGIGLGNLAEGGGGSGVPSIESAEERTLENPKDAQAFRDLATAHQAAGNTDDAIEAYENFIALRPKNTDVLRQLAGVYLEKASLAQQRAQIYQARADYLAPGRARDALLQVDGQPLASDPITDAVGSGFDQEINIALGEAQSASAQAVETYRRIAAAAPTDPTVQLELAQAAQSANDTATTIAAYEAFLKLAPDDPTVPEVRRILKQLRQFSATG